MDQNENYSQVDLRVGTEAQFNAKVGTLPAGTLFGITDATVSKADLSTDLKNEINGKINKPANPTSDSAVVINSSGTISTKPLSDIAGKSEVYIGSTTPTNPDEILWIDPNGTGGGGSSGGGGKLYQHRIGISKNGTVLTFNIYCSKNTKLTESELNDFQPRIASLEGESWGAVTMDITYVPEADVFNITISGVINSRGTATAYDNTLEKPTYTDNILEL